MKLSEPRATLDLAKQLETLAQATSRGPWLKDVMKNVGENWLLADVGRDREDTHYIVTTDGVHASQSTCEPGADAEFIVWCKNHATEIVQGLRGKALGKR